MFQALSRLSIKKASRWHAVTRLVVVALAFGLTKGFHFTAAGDASGTTRFDLALLVRIAAAVQLPSLLHRPPLLRASSLIIFRIAVSAAGIAALTGVAHYKPWMDEIRAADRWTLVAAGKV